MDTGCMLIGCGAVFSLLIEGKVTAIALVHSHNGSSIPFPVPYTSICMVTIFLGLHTTGSCTEKRDKSKVSQ